MTVNELIEMVDRLHPNQFTAADKLRWLNQVEKTIWNEIVTKHEGVEEGATAPSYTSTSSTQTLLAEDPYSRLYPAWMDAQIAYYNREGGKYADAITVFNSAYDQYRNYYHSKHMPIGVVNHLHLLDRTWGWS